MFAKGAFKKKHASHLLRKVVLALRMPSQTLRRGVKSKKLLSQSLRWVPLVLKLPKTNIAKGILSSKNASQYLRMCVFDHGDAFAKNAKQGL